MQCNKQLVWLVLATLAQSRWKRRGCLPASVLLATFCPEDISGSPAGAVTKGAALIGCRITRLFEASMDLMMSPQSLQRQSQSSQ